jgi:hypothetical protein
LLREELYSLEKGVIRVATTISKGLIGKKERSKLGDILLLNTSSGSLFLIDTSLMNP